MKKENVKCTCCKFINAYPIKKRLEWHEDKNPLFQLFPSKEEMYEAVSELQTCSNCGYTFLRLDEDTGVKKWMLKTKEFKLTDVPDTIQKAHQVAMTMQYVKAERYAVQWNLYCAVMLEDIKETELAHKYYKKCFVQMEHVYNSWNKKPNDLLILMNIMRLARMFQTVISLGNQKKYSYSGIERSLVEKMIELARKENADYIPFYDMLM